MSIYSSRGKKMINHRNFILYVYIEKIDQAVKDEGENPVWILTEDRMREIMEGKDWVADDPNH